VIDEEREEIKENGDEGSGVVDLYRLPPRHLTGGTIDSNLKVPIPSVLWKK